jgi:hypothetical protein
MVREI